MKLSSILLLLLWGAIAWASLGGLFAIAIAGVALVGFLMLELVHISRLGMVLLGFSLALGLVHFHRGSLDAALLEQAFGRAAFMAFFLISLFFLQSAAVTSAMVRRSGDVLVDQPPGRRYLALTFGSTVFGFLMSLGAITLLGSAIRQGVETIGDRRLGEIRLRRMTLALLRGFSTIPLWSPITVSMAIVLSALPEVSWIQVFPYGLAFTLISLLIGWLIDRFDPSRTLRAGATHGTSVVQLLPLVGLVVLMPVGGWALSVVLGISLLRALLLALPLMSLVWIAVQCRDSGLWPRLRGIWRRLTTDILPAMPTMRSEIAIFAGSALLGVFLVPLIDVQWIGWVIAELGLSGQFVLLIAMWVIVSAAIAGINPLVSVMIMTEILPKLPGLDISQLSVALMAVGAWSVSINVAPMSTVVRITGQVVMRDPMVIGPKWNGLYTLIIAAVLSAGLLALG